MTRGKGVLVAAGVAALLAGALTGLTGGSIATTVGRALGLFIISGLIPCVVWAFLRFRPRSTGRVITAWIVIMAVVFGMNLITLRYQMCLNETGDSLACASR